MAEPSSNSYTPNKAPQQRAAILLVDEDPASRSTLDGVVAKLDATLVAVATWADAQLCLAEAEFALLIVDLQTTGVAELQAVQQLRSQVKDRVLPIIVLTSPPLEDSLVVEGYALGVTDFLLKPLNPIILEAKLAVILRLHQEKAEAKREAEQLRLLIQGTADYAIFMLDPDGRVASWNLGAEKLKGYRAAEIIGEHFSRFYPQDALDRGWPQHELKVARSEGRFEDEGWRIRKDGTRFWANVVITALWDQKGVLRGFSKVTRDLTERRDAEEVLRQSEERLRLLIESVQDYAIFLLDAEGRVASWNLGAERIKQYTPDEIIGEHFSRFYPQEAIDQGWPAHELEVARAEGRFEDEGWRVRKDGTQFWANVVISALQDAKGTFRGFAKITRDMTQRRQDEEKTRQLLQEEAARRAAEASREEALRAQEQERQHRQQLQVTLTSIGDGVIVTDMEGKVTFMNPVAVQLTGWEPQAAAGLPLEQIFQIVNEETRRPVENPVTKVLREGQIVGLANHTVLIARDGTEVPIDDSGAPIRGQDGTIVGVVLVFRDVTEARRAVEARLHLAAIVESSDDAIISKNLDGRVTSWNQGAERLYGYTAEEILGQPISVLIPEDHPEEMPSILKRILQGERITHFETVRLGKDGRRVEVSLTISPIRNADGKVVGASKIARDITASKRQEATLRFLAEASKFLGELLDLRSTLQQVAHLSVPDFADWCIVDLLEADGSLQRFAVAHADPSKIELAGELHRRFPPDPKSPHGIWKIIRSGVSELISDIDDAFLVRTVRDQQLLQVIQKLGLRSFMGVPLASRGRILGVISFIAAESGRRYDAQDLALAKDLAQRAAVAIENARLYQEVQQAHRRKDEFLATLAHELRNPLAPIRTGLEAMKMVKDPAILEEIRLTMERQTQQLVALVDDLLDISRITQGKLELRKCRVAVADLLESAVESSRPFIDQAGHELTVALPDRQIYLDADPNRLAQVVSNLLNNAAKYTPDGGHIWLTVERQQAEVVVSIRDTGIGIPEEMLDGIFEMFAQIERPIEKGNTGLGIGLTLVKSLVEMHGGKVEVTSDGLNRGSEFRVRIPIPVAGAAELSHGDLPAEPIVNAHKWRVLVVDDNKPAADLLSMVIKLLGNEARIAYDGQEAIQVAADFLPHLVLMDIGMPKMNGYAAAEFIRQQPWGRTMILTALTGWGQDEDKQRTKEAGFDYHLVKPIEPSELQRLFADLGNKFAAQ